MKLDYETIKYLTDNDPRATLWGMLFFRDIELTPEHIERMKAEKARQLDEQRRIPKWRFWQRRP